MTRIDAFCDRVLDVAEALEQQGRYRRIVDQLVGSGTSVGANVAEADEAMSRLDFIKCLSIAAKELSETNFWLRAIGRRGWIAPNRLEELIDEVIELRRIFGAMIVRTRKSAVKSARQAQKTTQTNKSSPFQNGA